MLAPISMNLRLRIVRAVERGSSIRQAARSFAVSRSAAIKLMQRVRSMGSAGPARYGGHRRRGSSPTGPGLRRPVAATPDLTLAELQSELQRRLGVRTWLLTIHNALRRIGLRHEKRTAAPSASGLLELIRSPQSAWIRFLPPAAHRA